MSPPLQEARNPPRPNSKSRLLSLRGSTIELDPQRNGDVVLDRGKPRHKIHVENALEDKRAIFDRRMDVESSLHLQVTVDGATAQVDASLGGHNKTDTTIA